MWVAAFLLVQFVEVRFAMKILTTRALIQAALAAVGLTAAYRYAHSAPELPSAMQQARAADTPVDTRLIAGDNAFGLRLFGALAQTDHDQNIFISPTSAAIALTMAYNGAEGTTKEQMTAALALQGMSLTDVNQANAALLAQLTNLDPKVVLRIANGIWITTRGRLAPKPDFLARTREYYGAEVDGLQGAPHTINAWVRKQTDGKINSIVSESDMSNVVAILVNAVYFKGEWGQKFDKSATTNGIFTTQDGIKRDVPMMHANVKCPYLRGDGFQAISLPYGSGRARALLFLPDAGTKLADFLSKLTPENWSKWPQMFRAGTGSLALPRFRSEYEADLGKPLTDLGMGIAFVQGQADFAAMAGKTGDVWISKVRQKTFLEVNEEGTEAAAATGIVMRARAVVLTQHFALTFDRPFLCAIQDNKTGALLFLGVIRDPQ
jgi:serine protease inhibitor